MEGAVVTVRVCTAVALVAVALVAGCSNTTTGEATKATRTTSEKPTTTKTKTSTRRSTSTPSPTPTPAGLPPAAYDELRAGGVNGPNQQLSDLVDIACIFSASSFNDSRQDVADVLTQQGSALTPAQALVVVNVALEYSCPEYRGQLGG
jgi:hypothetical protein